MTHQSVNPVKVKTTAAGAAVHAADQFGVSVQRCALPAQLPRTATALGAVLPHQKAGSRAELGAAARRASQEGRHRRGGMLRRTVAAMLVARRCVSLAAKHRVVVVGGTHGNASTRRVAGEGVARQGRHARRQSSCGGGEPAVPGRGPESMLFTIKTRRATYHSGAKRAGKSTPLSGQKDHQMPRI